MKKDNYNEYMNEYMIKRHHTRKENCIRQLGGKCSKCGSDKNLEFDHIDPKSKSFTIGKAIVSVSEEKLQQELKKCQLLCKKCHEEKSLIDTGRKRAKGEHGTISSFRYCKCNLCREANNKWNREYKRKRRANNKEAGNSVG